MTLSRLFIITGDASGDLHASYVVRQLQAQSPECEIHAVGGPRLTETGIPILIRQDEHMGALGAGVFAAMPRHYQMGRQILAHLDHFKPDAVLLIDYGMFNLWMARKLKARGIRVFYYIPPQIWASRRHRLKAIKRFVDHVFCIFPFEKPIYDREGIPATYVGHPLGEELPPRPDLTAWCEEHGLDPALPIIGLFPGSRKSEVMHLLVPMIEALPDIAARSGEPGCQFVLAQSDAISEEIFQAALLPVKPILNRIPLKRLKHENYAILALSQVAIVSSGTVTLEAALYGTPTVITYRLSWLAQQVFKVLAYVRHIGLPNLLAEKPFLPEIIASRIDPRQIVEAVKPYLSDSLERQCALEAFKTIAGQLTHHQASAHVAENCIRLLES